MSLVGRRAEQVPRGSPGAPLVLRMAPQGLWGKLGNQPITLQKRS